MQLVFPFPQCSQRWRRRRASYRPPGECIAPREYDVAAIAGDGPAKAFVLAHHYAGRYVAARRRFGLYRHGVLVGVAVFSHPCHDQVLARVFPTRAARDALELGRFVLRDDVPHNGETWFLGRSFELLRREGFVGVVSFADPVARTDSRGSVIFPGHLGVIYQAHNGRYLGRARAQTLRLLPDGSVFSRRAEQKILHQDRGWRHAAAQLEQHGADPPPPGDPASWCRHFRDALTRPLRHGGNHKYAWPLVPGIAAAMPAARPFPKDLPSPHPAGVRRRRQEA